MYTTLVTAVNFDLHIVWIGNNTCNKLYSVVVVTNDDCHKSICGIVANEL